MNIQYIQQGKRSTSFITSLVENCTLFLSLPRQTFLVGRVERSILLGNGYGRDQSVWSIAIFISLKFFTLLAKLFTCISVRGACVFIPYISGIPGRQFSESTSQNDD
ncbi:hypothetical protein SGX61_000192 [Raoultella ornithinolytica]|uniref:hypothetical protein n=1 Tax=Raoultella ornithinolytica TaxID=54291 RepID=UPI001604D2AC|nr:hypothetical protein [Raoultella ornithinolytica]EJD6652055.1 hypothetical protein [Raoultella ornithinolytica]ELV3659612.1 hypothetical protein [Raoultella ornithinolytica]